MSKNKADIRNSKAIMGLGSVLIAIALIAIQFLVIFLLIVREIINLNIALPIWGAIIFVFTIYLVNKEEDSQIRMSWIILVVGLPIVGILLYIFLHVLPGRRSIRKKLIYRKDLLRPYMDQDLEVKGNLLALDKGKYNLSYYLESHGYPVYQNSKISYFSTGEELFAEIFEELEKAEDFILIEFFTVRNGQLLDRFYDILSRKVQEGVEVNFLHDGTNAFTFPKKDQERFIRAGINLKVFQPISAYLSTIHNNRDHRKLVIIDNKVSFTGGINIGDEYANIIEKHGYWKDTGIKIEGEATKNMTAIFMELWKKDDKDDNMGKYLNPKYSLEGEDAYVQPFGEIPYDDQQIAEDVYINIIDNAKDYVYITTPYITITETMHRSLTFAAQRGVEVRLLVPNIPDHYGIPQQVARTYYKSLSQGGVKIYEFTPGYNHSKMVLSDDDTVVIGTINMDYRSFYLHFENGVLIYDESFAMILRQDLEKTFSISEKYEIGDEKQLSLPYRFFGRVLRLFAPLF